MRRVARVPRVDVMAYRPVGLISPGESGAPTVNFSRRTSWSGPSWVVMYSASEREKVTRFSRPAWMMTYA